MKDSTFESKAYGKRVNKIISIEGRVQFDLLQVRRGGDGMGKRMKIVTRFRVLTHC